MADALKIIFGGDASQFKATLGEVEDALKFFKQKLRGAQGEDITNINFTISGLETIKSQLSEFGKFAKGSLGELLQNIRELNRQKLELQADPQALAPINRQLDELNKKVKELNTAGIEKPIVEAVRPAAESIAGLKLRIKELNEQRILIDPQINPSAIVKVNKEIDLLEDKVANLNNLGTQVGGNLPTAFGRVAKGGNQARIALTSLSLVAQDLPFGFIAIQNNLPAVISSFGALRASAISTQSVMLSLKTALIGPAGIFLAFSVLTAGVTYAVQKYGSLGKAIDVLTGKYVELGSVVKKAAESLKQYNENLLTSNEIEKSAEASQAGQILKIRTLGKAVLDLNNSENIRKKALQQLKKLDEPRFKNFDIEKGKIEGLSNAIQDYTRAIIAQAVAQKFTDQVSTTTVELEKQRNALANVLSQLDKYGDFQERLNRLAQEQAATARQGGIPRSANQEERAIQALVDKRKELETGIVTLANQLNEYNLSAQTATLTASSLASAIEETGNKSSGSAKKVKEYKEELSKVVPLFDRFQIKEKKTKQGLFFDFLEGLFSKNDLSQLKETYKRLQEAQKEIDKFRQGNQFSFLPNEAPRVRESSTLIKNRERLARIVKEFQTTYNAINDVFFNPLNELFTNFFETGKLGFKKFADDTLKELQRIVVSKITNKLLSLFANLIVPGSGFIVKAGLDSISTSALGDYLGALPGAANLGGITPSGMTMSGQVNVVLRGSDLIGAINRTNSTINRIG